MLLEGEPESDKRGRLADDGTEARGADAAAAAAEGAEVEVERMTEPAG